MKIALPILLFAALTFTACNQSTEKGHTHGEDTHEHTTGTHTHEDGTTHDDHEGTHSQEEFSVTNDSTKKDSAAHHADGHKH